MKLIDRWKLWRVRPGIALAAKLAEERAWRHANTAHLGPEQNLMTFSHSLNHRLLQADEGNITGLCLSATTTLAQLQFPPPPIRQGERVIERER